MTEEINQQVDSLLEGTEEVAPTAKKRTRKAKPFSLNDQPMSVNFVALWGKMILKKTIPDELASSFPNSSPMEEFEKSWSKVLSYCAMFPINIADLKVSTFFDLSTCKEKPFEELDKAIDELVKANAHLDLAIVANKGRIPQDKVATMFTSDWKSIIEQLQDEISNRTANLEGYQRNYAQEYEKFKQAVAQLEYNKTESMKPITCPPEFYDNEFFQLSKVDETYAYFVTKDIMLVDPRSNGARPVNMGKFMVRINPRHFDPNSVKIYPFFNNIMVNDYCHPHVGSNGGICWGNAFDPAAKGFHERNFKMFFKVLYSLLSTYNHESPYVSMSNFANVQHKRSLSDSGARAWLNSRYYYGIIDFLDSKSVFFGGRQQTLRRIIHGHGFSFSSDALNHTSQMDYLNFGELKVFPIEAELELPESLITIEEDDHAATIQGFSHRVVPFMAGDKFVIKNSKIFHRQMNPDSTFTDIEVPQGNVVARDRLWAIIENHNSNKVVTIESLILEAKAKALEGEQNETTTNTATT